VTRLAVRGGAKHAVPHSAKTHDETFWSAAEALSTGVILVNAQARILRCNPASEMLLGFSRRALAGTDLSALVDGLRELICVLGAQADQTAPCSFIAEVATPVRPARRMCVTVAPAGDEDRYLVEVSDVHQAIEQFREEHQSDLSGAARGMLRNLAHEIKNPLGGIRGAAQLLEFELEDPQLREYTGVIIHEADRLQGLLDRMLVPYRTDRRIREINIHEVLERVRSLTLAEYREGLVIRRDYDVSLPEIMGDAEQLIQVFLNLVKNAAQALDGRIREGTAEIVLRTRIARMVTIQSNRYRMALCVTVADNGPGIAPDLRERIFYPLVTGRADGTGLGLSLVKTYVEQNAGSIQVQSAPGRTEFSILFPLGAPLVRAEG